MRAAIENPRTKRVAPRDLSHLTDEELLALYKSEGDRTAFESLVQRYERELYSYLRRYLGDATLAEDAFQATFLQVHLKMEQFDPERKFRPWLYTIATNQAIDAQRRNKRHRMVSLDRRNQSDTEGDIGSLLQLLVGKEPGAASNLEREERQAWIRQAVENLPEQLRSALVLVYYQGMKYREAADVLGIPVGTVKSRLHAAILKLNEAWHENHPTEHE
ncbi:MAG: sigma-70 family RNA polymerase sigma factor [Pirellulales bacterium]